MINIPMIDHIGIRVADADRSLRFYEQFGFKLIANFEVVYIMRTAGGAEINLVVNANNTNNDANILMDVDEKYPGITHVAFRIDSMEATVALIKTAQIPISEGPVELGRGQSVFIRDPDRNTLEFREEWDT